MNDYEIYDNLAVEALDFEELGEILSEFGARGYKLVNTIEKNNIFIVFFTKKIIVESTKKCLFCKHFSNSFCHKNQFSTNSEDFCILFEQRSEEEVIEFSEEFEQLE